MVDRTVVFFDFDQTLVEEDTLPLFLRTLVGKRAFRKAIRAGVFSAAARPWQWRTRGREVVLHHVLRDIHLAEVEAVAHKIAPSLQWKPAVYDALHDHARQDHCIVVATGSLEVYMPVFLAHGNIPCDYLLATRMEKKENRLTGRMASPSCTRDGKVERIKEFLAEQTPFSRIISYGNLPDDKAMLEFSHQGYWISKNPHKPEVLAYKSAL